MRLQAKGAPVCRNFGGRREGGGGEGGGGGRGRVRGLQTGGAEELAGDGVDYIASGIMRGRLLNIATPHCGEALVAIFNLIASHHGPKQRRI